MVVDWNQVLTQIGSATVIVAALAWLAQTIISQFLHRSLDRHSIKLQTAADLQIAQFDRSTRSGLQRQKEEFDRQMVGFQVDVNARQAQADRIRVEIERWANPILGWCGTWRDAWKISLSTTAMSPWLPTRRRRRMTTGRSTTTISDVPVFLLD
jgi:hypothetical protein